MPQVDLIDYLDQWIIEHSKALRGDGIDAEFGRGDEARPKTMAFCNFETTEWIGELLLWSSGEVELGATRRTDGEEVNEHHHAAGQEDLESLLQRLRDIVRPSQPRDSRSP